eukprot:NODE_201_length_13147_cov_1.076104.p1 type:complete len:804 gc:universal NODE_201_length_13147_cov_1.076104:8279-5868(-)
MLMWHLKSFAKIGKYTLIFGTASGAGFATYVGSETHHLYSKISQGISSAYQNTKQHAFNMKEHLSDKMQSMAVSLNDDEDHFPELLREALDNWKTGVVETLKDDMDMLDNADEFEVLAENILMKSQPHEQFNPLIKKLLNVQGILEKLNGVGVGADIQLPSIVVIGSQSSGKSSVLESIIGHEFLPKGNNMVTKRPLELTLINGNDVFATFDDMTDLGKISSFKEISHTLSALNNSVSIDQMENAKPIKLTIHSPYVPDLRLIDLPGYIRVVSQDQPPSLKDGIENLCEKYVQFPNIILAVSAADVDLANSDSLRIAKRVDPEGKRTLGVITKLDRVEPQMAANILGNKNFPLRLGYIGVVCPPGDPTLLKQKTFPDHEVGIDTLRSRLVEILTSSMKSYSEVTLSKVLGELDKEKYSFNVKFHDTRMTPQGYIDALHDQIKHHIRKTVRRYNEERVLHDIQGMLNLKMLQILENTYFTDENIGNIDGSDYWVNNLLNAASLLTKSGIGRLATHSVHEQLSKELGVRSLQAFQHHPELIMDIDKCIEDVVKERLLRTVDQIEHILKPWKSEHIGSEVGDIWENSRQQSLSILKSEMKNSWDNYYAIQNHFGRWKFPTLLKELKTTGQLNNLDTDEYKLVQEALYFESRAELLKARVDVISSKACKGPLTPLYHSAPNNWFSWFNSSKENDDTPISDTLLIDESLNPIMRTKRESIYCPEAFLFALATQMSSITAKYIWLDLVLETYTRLPFELEDRVFSKYRNISRDLIGENTKVESQIDAQDRVELLEVAANELRKIIRDKN